MSGHRMLVGGGCAAVLAACAGMATGQTVYTPIALTNVTNALGPNNGTDVFTAFSNNLCLNNNGQVAFACDSTSTNATAAAGGGLGNVGGGIWVYSGGANFNVAALGGAALGGGTYDLRQSRNSTTGVVSGAYQSFGLVNLNDATDYSFRMGGGGDPTRLYSSAAAGGQMGSTCMSSTNAPGLGYPDCGMAGMNTGVTGGSPSSTALFSSFTSSPNQYMNAAGQYLFFGSMVTVGATPPGGVTSANASGVWMGKPGSMLLVVREGDATSYGSTVLLGTFSTSAGLSYTSASNRSNMIGLASLTGSGVTTGAAAGNDSILLSNRNGGTTVNTWETIARRGDAAPDENGVPFADGTQYRSITATSAINNAGKVAFTSTLRNGVAGTNTSYYAMFTDANGTMKAYVRTGTPVPASTGIPSGPTWNGFYSNININSGGTVVFVGNITGTGVTSGLNDTGLFKITPDVNGTITTVVRAGTEVVQNVPLKFGEIARYGTVSNVAENALGQVAFMSSIASSLGSGGGSLTPAQRSGLFLTDLTGAVNLIAQTGTLFQVAPGDLRTIAQSGIGGFNASGGEDGHAISLNANGDLLFTLNFNADTSNTNLNDDVATSGLFLVHIPAPGSGALLGLGGLLAARRRRR